MTPRKQRAVRLGEDGLAQVTTIAAGEFEGNESAAIRRLLALGLAAWAAGARTPDQVGRKR